LIFFIILTVTYGCAGVGIRGEKERAEHAVAVPFFPQDAYQCGPVSLAEVLAFWGLDVTPEEIAADVFSSRLSGTLSMDMVLYPRRKGFRASAYSGGVEDIHDKIRQGYPLVVLVDFGFSFVEKNHFMVIVGYNDNGVFAHSGRERGKFFSYGRLQNIWKKTGYWTLFIRP